MRILGQVEGKRRDDARAWKLPMPSSRRYEQYCKMSGTYGFLPRLMYTSGVPERDSVSVDPNVIR